MCLIKAITYYAAAAAAKSLQSCPTVRPRTAAYQASPSIDQPFFLMTLSIIPDFKRRRNRKTGVGRKVGKVQMYVLIIANCRVDLGWVF